MSRVITLTVLLLLTACAAQTVPEKRPPESAAVPGEEARAVNDILRLAAERTLANRQAGAALTWPEPLVPVMSTLREEGYARQVKALARRLDDGAGEALGASGPLLLSVIDGLTVENPETVLTGPRDAATTWLKGERSAQLEAGFRPLMLQALQEQGFFRQYRGLMDIYDTLPQKQRPAVDVKGAILEQAMAVLFKRLAAEEAAIREAPAQRGNALIEAALGR